MEYVIMTDTSANLPSSVIREGNLAIVPFTYRMGEVEASCLNPDDFNGTAFYRALREGTVVTTSQINTRQFTEAMEPYLLKERDILYIGMSSGISGSYHAAERAADELRQIYSTRTILTVDTLGASLGEGLLVCEAIRLRSGGRSIEETAAQLNVMRDRMYQIFTVDDLRHLHRGGRISGAAAFLGTTLGIKPLLKGNEHGQIISCGKCRGRRRALEALADRYKRLVESPETQTIGIAHADCAEDAEYLANLLREKHPPQDIMTVMYEPVTGSHVGPGTLALFFLGGPRVRFAD